MRILHIENTAGVAHQIAIAQQQLGHHAVVLETYRNRIEFPHDVENYYEGNIFKILLRMLKTAYIARDFDIVHLHGGIARKRIDIPIIKRLTDAPLIVHYHGSETRMGYGMYRLDLPDLKIVSTPDLLEYHPDAHYIPNPINLNSYRYVGVENDVRVVKVVHIPSDKNIKGTSYVMEAVKELKEEGQDLELILMEDVSHEKAVEIISKADIVVDWINEDFGIYGMVSIESMALGKPVVCYLKEELQEFFGDCPIVSTSPENLKETLRMLINNPELRKRRACKGREFVKHIHKAERVASEVLKLYCNVMNES